MIDRKCMKIFNEKLMQDDITLNLHSHVLNYTEQKDVKCDIMQQKRNRSNIITYLQLTQPISRNFNIKVANEIKLK